MPERRLDCSCNLSVCHCRRCDSADCRQFLPEWLRNFNRARLAEGAHEAADKSGISAACKKSNLSRLYGKHISIDGDVVLTHTVKMYSALWTQYRESIDWRLWRHAAQPWEVPSALLELLLRCPAAPVGTEKPTEHPGLSWPARMRPYA